VVARPRLPRRALPPGAAFPRRPARCHRVPLRGGDRRRRARGRTHGRDRPQPAQGLPPLRHGAVPGTDVRTHHHRDQSRRSAACIQAKSATSASARRRCSQPTGVSGQGEEAA
jgi:hypothetical protein